MPVRNTNKKSNSGQLYMKLVIRGKGYTCLGLMSRVSSFHLLEGKAMWHTVIQQRHLLLSEWLFIIRLARTKGPTKGWNECLLNTL